MSTAADLLVRGAIAALGTLLLVLLIPAARDACWGLLFLADFVAGEKRTLFDRLTPEPKVSSSELAAGEHLRVPFDFYSPRPAAELWSPTASACRRSCSPTASSTRATATPG